MNKPVALSSLVAAALLAASSVASAQVADPKNSGYVISSDTQAGTNVVKSGFGLCWRTGYFAPAHAIKGCDDDLLPKAAAAPAPARPAPAPAPAPAPKPAPAPTSEKVTFAADAFFDFDKSVLKPEGKAKLDDLTGKLKDITLEVIIAVGHADRIGKDAYNQKLSERRAAAVKDYLVGKGVEANRVYAEGKGEKQPVTGDKCGKSEKRTKQLIECLQPDRRVDIEVIGTQK